MCVTDCEGVRVAREAEALGEEFGARHARFVGRDLFRRADFILKDTYDTYDARSRVGEREREETLFSFLFHRVWARPGDDGRSDEVLRVEIRGRGLDASRYISTQIPCVFPGTPLSLFHTG